MNGILEVTIVKDEVPLLIPVSLLRDLGACVDLVNNELSLGKYGKKTSMNILKSGHVSVDVLNFSSGGWSLPQEAIEQGLQEQDFRLQMIGIAMSNLKQKAINQFEVNRGSSRHVDVRAAGQDFSGYGESSCFLQCQHGGSQGGQASPGHGKMEGARDEDGADHSILRRSYSSTRRSNGGGSRLARRWLALWICASVWSGGECAPIACVSRAYEQARGVCRADQEWSSTGTTEDDQASGSRRTSMPTSDDQSVWCREPIPERGVVSGLPCPLEGGDYVTRTNDTVLQVEPVYQADDNGISIECRSPITNGGCEVSGNGVPMQTASAEASSAQGGSHQGSTFLQMREESVRVLCMGSSGARGDSSGSPDLAGPRGESRDGEDEGGDVRGNEASSAEGREVEAEGEGHDGGASREGRSSEGYSTAVQSERTQHGGVSDGACRSQAWRADAGSTLPASDGDGDHAEPTTLDDGSGWRGPSESSAQRSSAACRVDEESSGDQAGHDEVSRTFARGEVRGRGHLRDLTVEEMEELKRVAPWACELSRGGKAEQVIRSA